MNEGLLAEFESPEALIVAARRIRDFGCTRLDAFTPYPLSELDDVLALRRSPIPRWVFGGGLLGGCAAYLYQWWMMTVDYPLNVGGRPLHSAPALIPITFESTVLFAALTAFTACLLFSGLPRLWHPVFEVEGFDRVTIDRFWLGIDATDPRFADHRLHDELRNAGATRILRTRRCP